MKAMSEFPAHVLTKGLAAKAALVAEGKSEEEISTAIGEAFKFADNKLKYFLDATGVVADKTENLYRVRVVTFAEGETVPEGAVQLNEVYYIVDFFTGKTGAKPVTVKAAPAGRGGGKKDQKKGPKSSPWGLSPEEIAAKKEASLRASAAKSK